jgi:large subunit ribosomal protein L18
MKSILKKLSLRQKRIWRIRKKVHGTGERPRLCVTFSNKHIYAQAIDDTSSQTLLGVSSLSNSLKGVKLSANRDSAAKLAAVFSEKALAMGISEVVFDRHGRPYHGRVKAFAEAAREAGLKF